MGRMTLPRFACSKRSLCSSIAVSDAPTLARRSFAPVAAKARVMRMAIVVFIGFSLVSRLTVLWASQVGVLLGITAREGDVPWPLDATSAHGTRGAPTLVLG